MNPKSLCLTASDICLTRVRLMWDRPRQEFYTSYINATHPPHTKNNASQGIDKDE